MYLPEFNREERLPVLHALIAANPLGLLISAGADGPVVTPVPFILSPDEGPCGTLRAHVARANPALAAARRDAGGAGAVPGAAGLRHAELVRGQAGDRQGGADLELRDARGARPGVGDRGPGLAPGADRRADRRDGGGPRRALGGLGRARAVRRRPDPRHRRDRDPGRVARGQVEGQPEPDRRRQARGSPRGSPPRARPRWRRWSRSGSSPAPERRGAPGAAPGRSGSRLAADHAAEPARLLAAGASAVSGAASGGSTAVRKLSKKLSAIFLAKPSISREPSCASLPPTFAVTS